MNSRLRALTCNQILGNKEEIIMADAIAKVLNFLNANWAKFVELVDKIWKFIKDTILKDDSIFATTADAE